MEAKQINLSEWESFGGGGYGESFYNKTDDSVILKLNKTSVLAAKAQEEFRRSFGYDAFPYTPQFGNVRRHQV